MGPEFNMFPEIGDTAKFGFICLFLMGGLIKVVVDNAGKDNDKARHATKALLTTLAIAGTLASICTLPSAIATNSEYSTIASAAGLGTSIGYLFFSIPDTIKLYRDRS